MFHRAFMNRLMAPEGAGGGAGGGGAGAGGAGPAAGAFDEDAFLQKVSQMMQKALTSRDSQSDKKREQDKKDLLAKVDEMLAARGGAPSADPDPDGNGGGGKGGKNKGGGGAGGPDDVKMTTLQKRLDEQERATQSMLERYQEERRQRRQVDLLRKTTEALNAVGITGDRAEAARDALLYRGQVAFQDDDSDEVVFRGQDGVPTELPLGMRQWSKGPAAQIYLPPSGIGGSGSRPGQRGPGVQGGKELTQDQRLAILADHFDRNIG